jgi:hypothetical protein
MKTRQILFLMVILLMTGVSYSNAQVTIGKLQDPRKGALLDLNNDAADLGLLLPNVALQDVNELQLQDASTPTDKLNAKGMVVYNTSKATKGGGGIVGEFLWNGKKWIPIGTGTTVMTLTTVGDSALVRENALCAQGGYNVHAIVEDPDCDTDGNYQFIVLSGAAQITPVSSVTSEFDLQFEANPLGQTRQAVVQVINPCGNAGTWVFYQQGANCGEHVYQVKNITYLNGKQSFCTGGSVYAEITEIQEVKETGGVWTDEGAPISGEALNDHTFIWMLGNSQIATGRGVTLSQRGNYYVYVDMQGCGKASGILTITQDAEKTAPIAHKLLASNDGILCGSLNVDLQVLGVQSDEKVYWFKDGLHQTAFDYGATGYTTQNKKITLNNVSDNIGEWYAVVVYDNATPSDDCLSSPSNKISVTQSSASSGITTINALINDQPFNTPGLTLCANSTVKLEIGGDLDALYGPTRRFYWYINDQLWGESTGQAIYVVPRDLESAVLSVKLIVNSENCPITTSTDELPISFSDEPLQTALSWQGEITNTAYICGSNPAEISAVVQNGKAYQWFKNGSTTPYLTKDETETDLFARRSTSISEPGNYQVRYQNTSGCWSTISEPITVSNSGISSIMWYMKPEDEIINETDLTWSVRTSPSANSYGWNLFESDGTTPLNSAKYTLQPLDDGSSVMVRFKYSTSELATAHPIRVKVTAINACGEATLTSDEIDVINACAPITSLNVTATANSVQLGDNVRFTGTANGSTPTYFRAWCYLDNANTPIPGYGATTWLDKANTGGGTGADVTLAGMSMKVYKVTDNVIGTPTHSFDPTRYVKILILDWIDASTLSPANQLTVTTFAEGDHQIYIDASNSDGTAGSGCTLRDNPIHSALRMLHVEPNPSSYPSGVPAGIDYALFHGQKTCFDVHKTGDTGTNSWNGDRLPLNVRPDDFPASTMVNGLYAFTYEFSIGQINPNTSALTSKKNDVNLKYSYEDPNGIIDHIEKLSNNNVVVYFKPNVVSNATGTTRNSHLTAKLYALYEYNDSRGKQEQIISVQDAACGCPAKVGSNTWAMLNCHNCGSDETKNPKTATSAELRGGYYKWGYGIAPYADRNQSLYNSSSYIGPVVSGQVLTFPGSISGNYIFTSTTAHLSTWEVPFQPCKPGWTVGSYSFWQNIESQNRWDSNLRTRIINIGKYVDLPKEGYFYGTGTSTANAIGDRYDYWTSTPSSTTSARNFYGTDINGSNISVDVWGSIAKYYSEPIRCVQEGSTYTGSSDANNP